MLLAQAQWKGGRCSGEDLAIFASSGQKMSSLCVPEKPHVKSIFSFFFFPHKLFQWKFPSRFLVASERARKLGLKSFWVLDFQITGDCFYLLWRNTCFRTLSTNYLRAPFQHHHFSGNICQKLYFTGFFHGKPGFWAITSCACQPSPDQECCRS